MTKSVTSGQNWLFFFQVKIVFTESYFVDGKKICEFALN